jgi:serine carboxypeptidase-like clade 1
LVAAAALLISCSAADDAAAKGDGAGRNVITHIKGFEGPLPFHLETGYVARQLVHHHHHHQYVVASRQE